MNSHSVGLGAKGVLDFILQRLVYETKIVFAGSALNFIKHDSLDIRINLRCFYLEGGEILPAECRLYISLSAAGDKDLEIAR